MKQILKGKVNLFVDNFCMHIRVFGFEGNPYLLLKYVCDIFLLIEVYKKYYKWHNVINGNKIRYFIPFLITKALHYMLI